MVVPADWKEIRVGDCAHITTGKKNTQDRVADGKYPFFVRSQNVERINSYSYDGEAVLTAGDGVGTGKVFHYITGKFDCHQRVYRITDFRSDLNGKFFHLLFSRLFYDRIMSMTAKSSVDSVRMEMISDMELVVPSSIREQEVIAAALSDADAAIESLDALITKKRDVKQATMQQLLTGRIRLPGFTADWKEVRLGEVVRFTRKTLDPFLLGEKVVEHFSIPAYDAGRAELVPASTIKSLKMLLDEECVLVSRLNPRIPRVWHVLPGSHEALASTEFMPVVPNAEMMQPYYLMHLFLSDSYTQKLKEMAIGTTGSHQRVQPGDVLALFVNIPPLKEQEAIAETLSAMDDELEALTEQVSKLRMVKEGMMQDLLTGKVRLV